MLETLTMFDAAIRASRSASSKELRYSRSQPALAFGREEFLRQVAAHLGRSEAEGERAARSVFAAARKVLEAPHLLRDVDRELPDDLREIWETPERA
jgi:uncharacterized protein (DUF2267 family)